MWEWDQTQFLCFPGVAFLVGGGRLIHPLPYPPVPHHFLSTSGKKLNQNCTKVKVWKPDQLGWQTHTHNPCCLFQPSSWWRSWLSRARQGRAGGKQWEWVGEALSLVCPQTQQSSREERQENVSDSSPGCLEFLQSNTCLKCKCFTWTWLILQCRTIWKLTSGYHASCVECVWPEDNLVTWCNQENIEQGK